MQRASNRDTLLYSICTLYDTVLHIRFVTLRVALLRLYTYDSRCAYWIVYTSALQSHYSTV